MRCISKLKCVVKNKLDYIIPTCSPAHIPWLNITLFCVPSGFTDFLSVNTRNRININLAGEHRLMGKYILGWIMGVPVIVLVVIYYLFQ